MNKEAEINKELIKVLEEKIQLLEEQKVISQKIIDIQKEQLTLTDVSHQRELLIDFAEKVYRRVFFTWDKKTSEKVVDEYIKGNL